MWNLNLSVTSLHSVLRANIWQPTATVYNNTEKRHVARCAYATRPSRRGYSYGLLHLNLTNETLGDLSLVEKGCFRRRHLSTKHSHRKLKQKSKRNAPFIRCSAKAILSISSHQTSQTKVITFRFTHGTRPTDIEFVIESSSYVQVLYKIAAECCHQ